MTTLPVSQPRAFPDSGFHSLDSTVRFEEETLPDYLEERYYPVHIGEIFKSQYQAVTKLGFGSSSTVWLCRDLYNRRYLVLKVHVRTKRQPLEVVISDHLKAMHSTHAGERYVRLILDAFEILGPYGGDALPENLLRPTLRFVLIALDYLHQANIIHTDVQPNNILLGIDDDSILAEMEEDEISNPCPQKQLPSHTIYATRAMPLTSGLIMPNVYRAPEVLLGMDWDNRVDIWGVGQMALTLFEQGHLFRNISLDSETEKAQRFAEMISLLGPPPVEFLRRSKESLKFWDENGNWKSSVKIPEQSLEGRESRLKTDSQVLFLRFLRKTLRWLPEERPTAKELLLDEWLRGDDY
ncbi:kinase domain protein [Aspergillus parasiticus]|uniref:non-specific serine/threonine protein kinase n=1 Tax=Aspergillus parasiticus TaxID=5067 RepID=A0A5N6DDH3_ASPPA|nr:kinase domain protein [Aspergillus parasiticus]